MKPVLSDELMQSWTPSQLLAVYDFCQMMSEQIWQQHEDALLDQMMEADRERGHELLDNSIQSENLELPFDDINHS